MMLAGVLLFAYAALLGTVGAVVLRRARWTDRAPRLGVAAWQALSVSVLAAVLLAGIVMLLPGSNPGEGLALWCLSFVAIAAGVMLAAVAAAIASVIGVRRVRRTHLMELAVVGVTDRDTGAVVIDHPVAAAYCLPGRQGVIVFTTAAIEALDESELQAVLEHEKAHLRGRHDLILAVSGCLSRALGVIPVFRWSHDQQQRLLEMVADDAAARTSTRRTVATAMLHMAEGAVRLPALGAGGSHAVGRVDRLLRPSRPLGRVQAFAVITLLAAALAAPVGLAVAPSAAATEAAACGPSS